MRVFRFLLLLMLGMSWSVAFCVNNTENASSNQEKETTKMISAQKEKLDDAIDEYKKALEKKKEMMTKLWKTVKKIEFLMKENQVLRKEMIKYWEDVKQSHSSMQSL